MICINKEYSSDGTNIPHIGVRGSFDPLKSMNSYCPVSIASGFNNTIQKVSFYSITVRLVPSAGSHRYKTAISKSNTTNKHRLRSKRDNSPNNNIEAQNTNDNLKAWLTHEQLC